MTVRGPGLVAGDLAAVAVAGIDDEIALVDDEPVAVSDLWAEVLDAAGAGARALTLVCPTWWTADRCDRVRDAAPGSQAVVMQRVQALSASLPGESSVVVEVADELVMVSGVNAGGVALARHAEGDLNPDAVVRAVLAIAGRSAEVVVDAPAEVAGAVPLGNAVVAALRRRGVVVTVADARTWRDTLVAPDTTVDERIEERTGRRRWTGRGAICATAAVASVLGGIVFAAKGGPADVPSMTVLVEGRVGMQIPADWTVRRVTDGPGSARVQVVSPNDPQVMIHLTQSGVGDGTVADTVARALQEQPAGVFVDFDPSAVVAARPVVGYREVRTGREIRWAVFVDGAVRIAVGCQSAPGRDEAVRPACQAATRSAHAVF
ncbi:type VII secretion-associated protein [Mycobacterium sp. DL440]|uniref:type VII secretion-associated protein n=1 Tax=Mycobacterium sp. DL440 TaxID=2675523 RepID=UPI001FB90350|nr:type VII secretion-associated protein [Mycobacterium sp. DL440]